MQMIQPAHQETGGQIGGDPFSHDEEAILARGRPRNGPHSEPLMVRRGYRAALLLFSLMLIFCLSVSVTGHAASGPGPDTWSALQEALDQTPRGETVTLTHDLTAGPSDDVLVIAAGRNVVLDLNGHTLNRNLIPGGQERPVLSIEAGGVLTVRDSGAAPGVITGGYYRNGGGIVNHGTLILEGGRITGNNAIHSGGGVANYDTMLLLGGEISGNDAGRDGGGVYNHPLARLTIQGNLVFGNSAPKSSDISNEGTITLSGTDKAEVLVEEIPAIRSYINDLAVLPAVVLLLALLLGIWLDPWLGRQQKRTMHIIVGLVFLLILQNYLDYLLSLSTGKTTLRTAVSVLGYSLRPAILVLFCTLVAPDVHRGWAWALTGVNCLVYLSAFFSGFAFYFLLNHFVPGPLHNTCALVSAVLLAWLFYLSLRQFRPRPRKDSWLPLFVAVLIIVSVEMDYSSAFEDQPVSFLTIAVVISCVFYYIWLHLQFVRRHEQELLAGQRIQIMLSQIQPHFLFNSLEVIRRLYRREPDTADAALLKFERYLRGNMDALAQDRPIPFRTELERTKLYLDLEQLRFPDELHIVWEIRCTDFLLPSLTLQPLAENAVKHGVRGKKSGEGTVSISTQEYEDRYEVCVSDDGNGFDPEALHADDHSHIGLSNVRERLRYAGAELRIETGPEIGTKAVIVIPKTPL